MKLVHQREHLNEDDTVIIGYSQQCNIRLMSDTNFRSLKNGERCNCHDGAFDCFPTKIKVSSTGFRSIAINTVTRRPISMTCRPNFKWSIKSVRRSGSQFA